MIHENYLKKVISKTKDLPIENMIKITDSISRGDNIETSIYTDQNWYLQNIHGFLHALKHHTGLIKIVKINLMLKTLNLVLILIKHLLKILIEKISLIYQKLLIINLIKKY